MRRLFFAFLLIPLALPAQRVADIRIHPAITHRWSLMYREFSTEWLDCIYGKIIGDTVEIVGVFPADTVPSASTPNTVSGTCVPLAGLLIGDAHNHPRDVLIRSQGTSSTGERFPVAPEADLCYLSPMDWHTFRENVDQQVSIVICGQKELVLFLRNGEGGRCRFDPEQAFPECVVIREAGLDLSP